MARGDEEERSKEMDETRFKYSKIGEEFSGLKSGKNFGLPWKNIYTCIQALAAETTKRIISLDGGGSGDRGNTGRRRSRSRSPLRNKNRSRSPIDTKRYNCFCSRGPFI